MCARACMRACARVFTRACMRACVYARVRVCMRDVFAIYDIILYFIEIRLSDNFPSTGIPASSNKS